MTTNGFFVEDSGNLEECVLSLRRIEKLLKKLITVKIITKDYKR